MAVIKKRSQKNLFYSECMYASKGCTCGHQDWQIAHNRDYRKQMTRTMRRKEERDWKKDVENRNFQQYKQKGLTLYPTILVANTFINLSFEQKNYINNAKLNRLMFFASCEYMKANENNIPLISEMFSVYPYGPVLESLFHYYKPLNGEPIKKFMKNVNGEPEMLNIYSGHDTALETSIVKTWFSLSRHDWKTLSEIARREDSAWDKAYQQDHKLIPNHTILQDNTYWDKLTV